MKARVPSIKRDASVSGEEKSGRHKKTRGLLVLAVGNDFPVCSYL
jgi:hypothetical protein